MRSPLACRLLTAVVVVAGLTTCALAAEVSSPRHAVIAADKGQLVAFHPDGTTQWQRDGFRQVHGIQWLPNGNLLTQRSWTLLVELDPAGNTVWEYDAGRMNGNQGKKLEVHAFQRIENDRTMIVENGIGRVIEIDRAGNIQHQFDYRVATLSPHRDVRRGYKLDTGHYLLCHESEGRVTEYGPSGEIVWDYAVPLFDRAPAPGHGPTAWGNQVFNARRLATGNTLIATGNGHAVIEVTPENEIVWQLHQHDLPGITLAWTTTLELLANGNILIGNCHAGPENPQLIEVTRDKRVVWTFRDFEHLGDSTAASMIVPAE